MTESSDRAVELVQTWRGEFPESSHRGHAVIVDETGQVVASWGDENAVMLPRSACKMLQALPLVESGAADAAGLGSEQLALACASHQGSAIHTERVEKWTSSLGLREADFRCGAHYPYDTDRATEMRIDGEEPCQFHNNCSGKHSGFLTLNRHLGGGAEYVEADHPVQQSVRAAHDEMTEDTSPGYGIDGCSAPNFATTMKGFATALAKMARPETLGPTRGRAASRLVEAMMAHPELVAGEGRACTQMMRAMPGRAAIKTGAEAVFSAILPEHGFGIAIKIEDGATRASECVIAALLVRLGVAHADDPVIQRYLAAEERNRRGILTGHIRPTEAFYAGGAAL
ncbi:L-asparaginase II [Rubricella aquisinus]|uniref:L-asparaginase II n=1 Tax=Rubricella aquisinus TaxID=2028108 RepID=A0A840WPD5_9RHOB|nr:asparaginase [Rubricella aquisinus]MBB5516918.1 L-asparaginase II [Rubricella aquisinus]